MRDLLFGGLVILIVLVLLSNNNSCQFPNSTRWFREKQQEKRARDRDSGYNHHDHNTIYDHYKDNPFHRYD